jgi:hypothetical protein
MTTRELESWLPYAVIALLISALAVVLAIANYPVVRDRLAPLL